VNAFADHPVYSAPEKSKPPADNTPPTNGVVVLRFLSKLSKANAITDKGKQWK